MVVTFATEKITAPSTYQCSVDYAHAGLSIIPVKLDGTKAVALDHWSEYQIHPPTEDDLLNWFAKNPRGIGIVGGSVSGGLEILDFDHQADQTFLEFRRLVDVECPGLMA